MPETLDWKAVINRDLPPMEINETGRAKACEYTQSGRYSPVDARLATGMFYTDEEYALHRKRVIRNNLP